MLIVSISLRQILYFKTSLIFIGVFLFVCFGCLISFILLRNFFPSGVVFKKTKTNKDTLCNLEFSVQTSFFDPFPSS